MASLASVIDIYIQHLTQPIFHCNPFLISSSFPLKQMFQVLTAVGFTKLLFFFFSLILFHLFWLLYPSTDIDWPSYFFFFHAFLQYFLWCGLVYSIFILFPYFSLSLPPVKTVIALCSFSTVSSLHKLVFPRWIFYFRSSLIYYMVFSIHLFLIFIFQSFF